MTHYVYVVGQMHDRIVRFVDHHQFCAVLNDSTTSRDMTVPKQNYVFIDVASVAVILTMITERCAQRRRREEDNDSKLMLPRN
jgi:hypothetical protein